MPDTVISELNPYLDAAWQLIPLHRWDYRDEVKGKTRERGKSPFDSGWTTKPYKNADQVKHMEGGANVGVRLRASDLVIDVDPRNFKKDDNPFKRLCEDCGLDPDLYPTVETGSGGLHIYMTKPEDVSVRDSLPDYEGVEFKTIGRQVVAAGSIHPNTKNYVWDFLRPGLSDVIAAPDRLINIIRRPLRALATGGGEHSQEELAAMLEALDPTDFSNSADWLPLMQACHHATAGDGRSEFIEWSTGDPDYSDDAGLIGQRWDSLHADNDGDRVTYRTLYKILMDNDAAEVIPRRPAEDDFEALDPEDISAQHIEEHEQKGPLEKMNDQFYAVLDGSQFKIFWEVLDPTTGDPQKGIKARKRWIKATQQTFLQYMANKKIQSGDKVVPKGEAWLEWAGRRTADGVIFDPERDHEGFLNLWTGWGHDPRKGGSWAMLDELLFEVLCDGDERVYNYTLDWAAHMVQHPASPAEVAICFKGAKGTGKGTWGRALVGLAGKHGMHITSPDQITGKFNDHLRDVILLFADEAITPYDKASENRLKGLITEPRIAYEGKRKDIISDRNMLHIMMASNEDWFVPFGMDGERRFMVQEVNNKRKGDVNFFNALNKQMNGRGYSALLWDLLQRDIKGWAPRERIPVTKAAMEQQMMNMGPVETWWFNALNDGIPPFPLCNEADWEEGPIRVFRSDLKQSFEQHCRKNGIRSAGAMGRGNSTLFSDGLRKFVPDLKDMRDPVPEDRQFEVNAQGDGRAKSVRFPDLKTCRKDMARLLAMEIDWSG